jgi:hypothetical protein
MSEFLYMLDMFADPTAQKIIGTFLVTAIGILWAVIIFGR